MDASELEAFFSTNDPDAQLCADVTGMPHHEEAFKRQQGKP